MQKLSISVPFQKTEFYSKKRSFLGSKKSSFFWKGISVAFWKSKSNDKEKQNKKKKNRNNYWKVPLSGLEPEWTLCPQTPQACVSTNFTITVGTNLLYHYFFRIPIFFKLPELLYLQAKNFFSLW